MKVLKTDLIKQVETLKEKLETLEGREATMRKEFAKAFNWTDGNNYSYESKTYRTPSWQEIFTEIGRLQAADTDLNAIRSLNHLNNEIGLMKKELKELKVNNK